MPSPPPAGPPPAGPSVAEPFDRAAWRRQRSRAGRGDDFLACALAADLAARVAAADRRFAVAVDCGGSGITGDDLTIMINGIVPRLLVRPTGADPIVAGEAAALSATADSEQQPVPGGDRRHVARVAPLTLVADPDRLPLADGSVDLIAALGLHAVNDLPGALILLRRALRPGGLFVAALVGGTTLAEVRADLLAAEVALTGRAAARILPMVDPQAAPGLLQRAGFADPVAEVDTLTVRYDDLAGVLRDLRSAGAGNILCGREPLRRDVLADAARRFGERAVDGRVGVTVQVIYLTGRAR